MTAALQYPATRYQTEAPTDLGATSARERLSAPALKAFFNIMAHWKVRDGDARTLLGGVSNGPFYEMKRNTDRVLDPDRLMRVSYLIGIYRLCTSFTAGVWPTNGCSSPTAIRSSAARRPSPT